jgi:hypothetical protein
MSEDANLLLYIRYVVNIQIRIVAGKTEGRARGPEIGGMNGSGSRPERASVTLTPQLDTPPLFAHSAGQKLPASSSLTG